jgi:hypothetical protein
MTLYHFQILEHSGARRDVKSLRLPDMGAVWREIGALAQPRDAEGRQIRVLNEAGGIVVLIGALTARSLQQPKAKAA